MGREAEAEGGYYRRATRADVGMQAPRLRGAAREEQPGTGYYRRGAEQRSNLEPGAPPAPGTVPAWANEKPETPEGAKLLDALKKDQEREVKRMGRRSIIEYLMRLMHTKLFVGRTQMHGHPGHFLPTWNIVRSRAADWQVNIHEAGHAMSQYLKDTDPDWYAFIEPDLARLADRNIYPFSGASAKTGEEGMAELIRRYIMEHETLDTDLLRAFENKMQRIAPGILAGLRDAFRAYTYHAARPLGDQIEADRRDRPSKPGPIESIRQVYRQVLHNVVGGSTVVHDIVQRTFRGIAPPTLVQRLDPTGLIGVVRERVNEAYAAQLKVARAFLAEINDTSADPMTAYQSTLHVPGELQHFLYGERRGREGIRVRVTGRGFADLPSGEKGKSATERLRDAGFVVPDVEPRHGGWLYLSDKSISAIKRAVGKDWHRFVTYAQARVMVHRSIMKGRRYPGKTEGMTSERLGGWVKDQERLHPAWDTSFKELRDYMNQLLLVPVLSGELSVSDAIRVKDTWKMKDAEGEWVDDYLPLPRQVEDRITRRSGAGAEPSSGLYREHGSALQAQELEDAIARRTKMAIEAYYTNRLMLSLRDFGRTLAEHKEAPYDVRSEAMRLLLPLKLDPQKLTTLGEAEQKRIIADYMNRKALEDLGIKTQPEDSPAKIAAMLAELLPDSVVHVDDLEISLPGRPVWRMRKPNAIHLIAPFEKGRRAYYQVTDPLLFEMLSQGRKPGRYMSLVSRFLTGAVAPWKRIITQNVPFALRNALARDPSTAAFMGEDGVKALVPYYYAAIGLVNRIQGRNLDAIQQSELLSKTLDRTTTEVHQGIVGSFMEMLKEGLALNYREMTPRDWVAEAPGVAMSAALKPMDVLNWLTGGRYLSRTGEELAREGAFIAAQRRGASTERAQVEYDYITGNFGQKAGSQNVAAFVRTAGFLNPSIQILWGQMQRITSADPKVRAYYVAAKIPALAMWGAIGAAFNVLLVRALHPDDDDYEEALRELRERPDEDRLGYMAIGGRVRLPFDYGLVGSAVSYGWNSTESWLLEDPIATEKKAMELLRRSRDVPGITDFINPFVKTGIELQVNHSFFFGEEIVPAWMEARYPYNPELQTWPTMPEVYNMIGRGLNVSPIKVRYAVKQVFTRQMDQVASFLDAVATGREIDVPDVPLLGPMVQREPLGFGASSVKNLAELDQRWTTLRARLKDIESRAGGPDAEKRRDMRSELRKQIGEMDKAHAKMRQVDRLWQQVKAERKKAQPDQERMRDLERQMRDAAAEFFAPKQ